MSNKMLKVVGASWLQTKISSYILGVLGFVAILTLFIGQMERNQEDGTYAVTVFYSEKTGYRIAYWGQSNNLADIPRGVARAYFSTGIDTTGWSTLEVETNDSYSDEIQAYAAGVVEGALTWSLIHTHLENTIRRSCQGPAEKLCEKVKDSLDSSVNVWKNYASEKANEDPFWHHVSLYYTQINGVYMGWKRGVERSQNLYETDVSDLYWLNAVAEVTEIQKKLNITIGNPIFDAMPSLSSAFIRIVNETSDDGDVQQKLYLAHNSVGSYTSMMRILKRYKLHYRMTSQPRSPPAPGAAVEFPGYPGALTSQDELYVLRDNGNVRRMVIAGTSIKNFNEKLWKHVNITEQVPLAPRLTAANHLAANVSAWTHLLAASNSGTGCKQWLLLDYHRFGEVVRQHGGNERKSLKDVVTEISVGGRKKNVKHTVVHRTGAPSHSKGILWLIEQVPSRTHSADLSEALLANGYWATYGLPLFNDIAEITHTNKMRERFGDLFSESESPRALAFKRGYENATDVKSIIDLMRQTNMTTAKSNRTANCTDDDKYCILLEDGYFNMLGVRGDIVSRFREPYGVIDTKVIVGDSSNSYLEFIAISSPPFTEHSRTNATVTQLNKGNVASVYTDKFDDQPTIDGDEIRDLMKQQKEEAELESIRHRDKHVVKPFQWSESEYKDQTPSLLPDKWNFEPFTPHWVW